VYGTLPPPCTIERPASVSGDSAFPGVVSHAGLALLRHLAGKTGLTSGLSRALASPWLLVLDRGQALADWHA
jgi:hypothetical protein